MPSLVAALHDTDACVRCEGAEDLGQLGVNGKAALPALRAAVKDPDGYVRVFAAKAVGCIEPDNGVVVPALIAIFAEEEADLRVATIEALRTVGKPSAIVKPLLERLRRDEAARVREAAAFALGQIGPDADTSECRLAEVAAALALVMRQDTEAGVRRTALRALAYLGPVARSIIRDLGSVVLDEDDELAVDAVRLLSRFGAEAIPALSRALTSQQQRVRLEALAFLSDLGPEASSAVPAIRKCLQAEDPVECLEATDALVRIAPGEETRAAAPVVCALSDHCGAISTRETIGGGQAVGGLAEKNMRSQGEDMRSRPCDLRNVSSWKP